MALLERDHYLREIQTHFQNVAAGRGRIVLIGGEAGVGKTSLVEEFCARQDQAVRTMRTSCDSLSTPGPFGPLLDIGPALGLDLREMLEPHRRRDELFHRVLAALRARDEPTIIVGEDAHWSDQASIELLRFLSRRIGDISLLFLVTYRDDELGPFHPLRRLLGDLASSPGIHRITLPPLTRAAVTTLAAGSGHDPAELFRRTGGNPFYLTEVLAADSPGVPATVSDAVLARAARLSTEGRGILDVCATIGATIEPDLLLNVAGPVVEPIEECLAAGLLTHHDGKLAFRHELTRDAILTALPFPRRRLLHQRLLAALVDDPRLSRDLARLAHHAELSGDIDAIRHYAAAAAEQASALHSYREAAAQYERLLRASGPFTVSERADVLEKYSFACYLTSRGDAAIAACRETIELWQHEGDRLREGDNQRWLSRLLWFEGRSVEAHEAGVAALRVLEQLQPGPELAMAYSNMSQLEMLRWNIAQTIRWGEKAFELADQLNEIETLVHAMINIGSARATFNDPDAWSMLEQAHDIAAKAGMVDHAGRALTNLSWLQMEQFLLDDAERNLAVALRYAADHDLDNYFWYLTAARATIHTRRGRWDDALGDVERALKVPSLSPLTRIVALTVRGSILTRRGQAGSESILDEALDLASKTGELQRLAPVRLARAEAAWLSGDPERAAAEARSIQQLAQRFGTAWVRGEVACWLHRTGEPIESRTGLAEPYALLIAGKPRESASAWAQIGCVYERACALVESHAEADIREAQAAFAGLGAIQAQALATRKLRDIGVRAIRRGPNATTAANPAGLTERQMDVLRLLSDGLTNAEIADRLFISRKTAGHHVSAILAKLGVQTRTAAVQRAAQLESLMPQK